jgi:hypothetical protein
MGQIWGVVYDAPVHKDIQVCMLLVALTSTSGLNVTVSFDIQ